MKNLFVKDLKANGFSEKEVVLFGWIKTKRDHGSIIFLDVADSTGFIQVAVEKNKVSLADWNLVKTISLESAIKAEGYLTKNFLNGNLLCEISAKRLEIIGRAKIKIEPQPRSEIDIFDPKIQEQLLNQRHFYLRNEKFMAILRFRHVLLGTIHSWFRDEGFTEINAPILTPTPLYDDHSAISLEIHGQKVFLTQCVGFYLESAVHAFEKVYNVGPSFRGEESRSKRHLMEYWHIKAEMAFVNFDDIKFLVEKLISDVVKVLSESEEVAELVKKIGTELCTDGLTTPYPCIKYKEVVLLLKKAGKDFEFGKSLGSEEESFLSSQFKTPFWVVGIPRKIEPFPYVIDANDTQLTKTADLIASNGYGELLGIAEKIHEPDMLEERLKEKNKLGKSEYDWIRDLRNYGCVPHGGFGMGLERFIRWLIKIPHVRDTIPFFRTFGRKIKP